MLNYLIILSSITYVLAQNSDLPPYIKQCHRSDPAILDCLKGSLHHLKPYLAAGIPEIEMPSVEPFIMDQLSLQLTSGPQGYRVNLKNMEVFGASNYTVRSIKLSDNGKPFEARVTMPRLKISAKYASSGVLLIIPASGSGDFNAVFDGITADLKGTVSTTPKPNGTFLHVDTLDLVLNIKKAQMSISKVFKNNRILTEATNLFLRENGGEVLKAMQPQLHRKLAIQFAAIANQLLKYVPVEQFLTD